MTVRETLDYSSRFQGVGSRADIKIELSRREKDAGIVPDPDIDTYIKAISVEGQRTNLQTDYILKVYQQLESGEYFLSGKKKLAKQWEEKQVKQVEKVAENKKKGKKLFFRLRNQKHITKMCPGWIKIMTLPWHHH